MPLSLSLFFSVQRLSVSLPNLNAFTIEFRSHPFECTQLKIELALLLLLLLLLFKLLLLCFIEKAQKVKFNRNRRRMNE